MNMYITPNDENIMAKTDSESIQNAINEAKRTGFDKVVIPRINMRTNKALWEMDKAVLLPDDIEIVLDNCYMRQADGCVDNVFRNENLKLSPHPDNIIKKREQKNIFIRGIGNAVIDGGKPNGLNEHTSLKEGYGYIYQNNTILLHNIYNFAIENITIDNQRWWAINLLYAKKGRLSNITFGATDEIINQDGIDLRLGCRDIIIENIYGQGGDDLIALSAFLGANWTVVDGENNDISNVIIKNVVGSSVSKAVIALRNMDSRLLHDITIDGVHDTSDDNKGKCPYAVIRIGQKTYYKKRPSILGETKNIYINNVHAKNGDAVMINVSLENSRISNIYCGENTRSGVTTSTKNDTWTPGGAYLKNVTIDHVYDNRVKYAHEPLLEFVKIDENDGMENVNITDIYSENELIFNQFE